MGMIIVDRRPNPKGKSHANRQRFIRVAKETIREAVRRSIRERALGDVDTREVVDIPVKRIQEPRFRHSSQGGQRDYVLPGNKEYVQGDTLPRPDQQGGGGGREGSPDGEGEDNFQFTLSRDEYLDVLFEELELPDLAKTYLKDMTAFHNVRAGFSASGSPNNLNLVRTMRNSLARRLCLHRPRAAELDALEAEIAALETFGECKPEDDARLTALRASHATLTRRMKRIAFIDPIDLRFNRYEPIPKPEAQAVMFCLMDVSGSMTEGMKDLAKRFFLLLHLFLSRKYDHIEVVFIRHTSEAKEVDEDTFFHSRETGGTVVSSALAEMRRIVAERYPVEEWNIYAAQASDGDNYSGDREACTRIMQEDLLPLCQYFAYIEVLDESSADIFRSESNASVLWRDYKELADQNPNFAMKRVFSKADIFPVFHQLFAKARRAAA
ncbi:MAG TPA: YeaH/YhbH family protein [Ferrovibrio sp.]|uniref:YeaH/YhbH family protein n=1 Tax=Ferrovibrio sp. TaxID=1917215 RepID=UPI002ED091CE